MAFMRKDFLNFLKAIFIFSCIQALLIYWGSADFLAGKINHITWLLFFYMIMITLLFHAGLVRAANGKPQAFVRYYMGATTFKLFIHIVVILLYCLFNRNEAVRFIVAFLIFYILFTGFEVLMAIRMFGRQKEKENSPGL